jgi:hypothetical protein
MVTATMPLNPVATATHSPVGRRPAHNHFPHLKMIVGEKNLIELQIWCGLKELESGA